MKLEERYHAWILAAPKLPAALVSGLLWGLAMSPVMLLFIAAGGHLGVGLIILGAMTLAFMVGIFLLHTPTSLTSGQRSNDESRGAERGEGVSVGGSICALPQPRSPAGEEVPPGGRRWPESAWPRPVAWWLRAFPPLVGAAVDAVVFAGPLLPVVLRAPPGRVVPAYLLAVALLGWSSYGARVRARRPGSDGGRPRGGGVSSGARGAGRRG